MEHVRLRDPEEMNVLSLLLAGYLESALSDIDLQARLDGIEGGIWIRAGKMWTTLLLDGGGRVELVTGRAEGARASVEGEMDVLLGVVTGGPLVLPVLTGKIGLGGNLLFLLRLLPLLTAGG